MSLFQKIKEFIQYDDSDYYIDYEYKDPEYEYDYYEESSNKYEDDITIEKIQTVKSGKDMPDFEYESGKMSEMERKHCLKLYELACGFNKIDAATVMCVLCQSHMDVVLNAISTEFKDMKKSMDDIKKVVP